MTNMITNTTANRLRESAVARHTVALLTYHTPMMMGIPVLVKLLTGFGSSARLAGVMKVRDMVADIGNVGGKSRGAGEE